eukprot:CAMPEP_0177631244 /NCGR_PEP_ID=MMETSP0447-20121125/1643_1 /TAXON_ID=0 /ORGANISM="Stygamoeba regulata, Strain BSH-02190019" /LENGTH=167 /DNA_ID=CAMNT_0019132709 /DNA_START=5 /DNA_END=508 /DNA_ORIENTATION=-
MAGCVTFMVVLLLAATAVHAMPSLGALAGLLAQPLGMGNDLVSGCLQANCSAVLKACHSEPECAALSKCAFTGGSEDEPCPALSHPAAQDLLACGRANNCLCPLPHEPTDPCVCGCLQPPWVFCWAPLQCNKQCEGYKWKMCVWSDTGSFGCECLPHNSTLAAVHGF